MPDPASGKIPGIERAAILLMTLGEQEAAEILKHMAPKEVQKIGVAMANLSNVPKDKLRNVIGAFSEEVENQTSLGIGSQDYIRKTLIKAIGEDKAGGLIDRILHGGNTKGLENLKWMEPRAVSEMIRFEHPQIIAIVLAYLDPEHSAEILQLLPENMRQDIVLRIATLDGIPPSALNELNEVLEKQFSGKTANVKSASAGGLKAAANILNFLDSSVESALIAKLKEADDALVQKIEDLMFVFEDLAEADDRGVQALLREIQSEQLLIALKGASEGIKEKIFKNMSKRAGEMLRDDLDAKGPVKLSDVEKAHKEIIAIARRMIEAGDLSLGGKGGEQYV